MKKPYLEVAPAKLSRDMTIYLCGSNSFDEEDRDLAYIDKQIHAWKSWRQWVRANGEHRPA
jgi:hypothetical protein